VILFYYLYFQEVCSLQVILSEFCVHLSHTSATCPTYPIHPIFIKVGSTTFRTLLHNLLPFPVTSYITSQHSLQYPQLISFQ
jgi:hypothetical protein